MAKEWYRDINFRAKSLRLINTINAVVADYQKQSLKFTLRQAFYQLVTKNIIPNTERSYKNLAALSKIIRDELSSLVDRSLMDKIIEQENKDKQAVREMARAYAEKQRKAKKS